LPAHRFDATCRVENRADMSAHSETWTVCRPQ
jgi:hypothetical protein